MNVNQHIVRTIAAWGGFFAFMVLFEPNSLPVVLLIVPFVLLFAALYSLWSLLSVLKSRFFASSVELPPRGHLGLAVCLGAVFLLVLQSLGQLTLRDVATVIAILTLGYLYIVRNAHRVLK
jgi:hypothetical protein